jgi:retron-type reverse transcriptase
MEDWQYHETLSGTPQGGVVSPLLSNIYLQGTCKIGNSASV